MSHDETMADFEAVARNSRERCPADLPVEAEPSAHEPFRKVWEEQKP